MASLTIRNLDEQFKSRLRVRAASHGHSMEEEARQILRTALGEQPPDSASLVERVRLRMAGLGGVDLPLAVREPVRDYVLPADTGSGRLDASRKGAARKPSASGEKAAKPAGKSASRRRA